MAPSRSRLSLRVIALAAAVTALAAPTVATAQTPATMSSVPTVPWATQAGGTSGDSAQEVSVLPDGSAIVTGSFEGTATFGTTTLTSSGGSSDVFVAKVGSSGSFAWATKAGGSGLDQGTSVSVRPDGSAIVTGRFTGPATFGATTLPCLGGSEVFVAQVDASGS